MTAAVPLAGKITIQMAWISNLAARNVPVGASAPKVTMAFTVQNPHAAGRYISCYNIWNHSNKVSQIDVTVVTVETSARAYAGKPAWVLLGIKRARSPQAYL